MKLSFIGLGVMGYPMAGFLSKSGYDVTVFNRTKSKAETWCSEFKGNYAETPRDAVHDAEMAFICVGNDDDVREVALGETGIINGLKKESIIIDHTTASAKLACEIHDEAEKYQLRFLDAPLSGGQAGAESGKLTIMVGGQKDVFDQASQIMNCYAKVCTLIGGVGSGQKAKMVNQICIAGLLQGLSEGLHFAKREKRINNCFNIKLFSFSEMQSFR